MELLRGGARGSIPSALLIALLLLMSMMLANPLRSAGATQSDGVSNQVVPTVLTGYKSSGPLPGDTLVDIAVGIPLQNVQSLQYLEQQISTPGSPLFRHFLTAAQVQSYLPTAEYDQALSYLQGDGFSIVTTGLNSIIVAEGTASQVSQYLGLSYEMYSNGQYSYYSASGVSPIPNVYLYSSNLTAALLAKPSTLIENLTSSPLISTRPAQSNQSGVSGAYPMTDLQSVYNVTGLYNRGDDGAGYTVGILDFEGDPYIAQQLQYYDEILGLPSSPLKVIPIGPYNPSLGTFTGNSLEISLDVESVHSMAPGASIDLYIANEALPLAADIAAIVQQGAVNDLSQSFTLGPESYISSFGASALELNVILADQYYLLGSAEGISFLASTGDVGGSGYAGGPEGTTGYPSTSPYVTAVGATTTYLTFEGSSVSSFYQTAWSNYGFVPDAVNYGGTTGGVSILEPKPWYQSGLTDPDSFASGRMVPDISLDGGGIPGSIIVLPGNQTTVSGGTSESVQLLGGLLTLIMGSLKTPLGLINPMLYTLGESSSTYDKAYYPITYGNTIPWVSTSGYNLATGWGAPNIGEMASLFAEKGAPSLSIAVTATVGSIQEQDILPGQAISIAANITGSGKAVTTGTFSASLDTLSGAVASVPLSYDSAAKLWTGEMTAPSTSAGMSYMTVTGSSSGESGSGFAEFFLGYLVTFLTPTADDPYSGLFGILVEVNATTLSGVPAPGPISISGLTYNIHTNAYTAFKGGSDTLSQVASSVWYGDLTGNFPLGPAMFVTQGDAYGYLPFTSGVYLQESYIETTVLAEPGVVAPGQSIFVLASLIAPVNTPPYASAETGLPIAFNVDYGSNLTVYLVSQTGKVVASTPMYYNSYLSSISTIQGALTVPSGIAPGLYDVILNSTFDSYDLNLSIDGSYFGQVYVAPATTPFTISVNSTTPYEGQTVTVNAKIDYTNGTSVQYGVYVGAIYPKNLQSDYTSIAYELPFQLTYEASTGLWSANVTLPSAYNLGGTLEVDQGALYLSGPYEVFVTGISADGAPTSTDISTQTQVQVQPYYYLKDVSTTSLPQDSGVAFTGDTVVGPSASAHSTPSEFLSNDLFLGSNTLQGGDVVITQSQIQGTLYVRQANVTLIGVSGGNIVATGSTVTVTDSSLQSIELSDSVVSSNASVLGAISPTPAAISIQAPVSGAIFNGTTGAATVTGQDVSSVAVYLDGSLIQKSGGGSTVTFPLSSGSLSVGVHEIEVVATQEDGISSSSVVYFSTDAALVAANNSISTVSTSLSSVSGSLSSVSTSIGAVNSSLGSLAGQVSAQQGMIDTLNSDLKSANDTVYALAVIAVVALVVAIVAVVRKPKMPGPSAPPSPVEAPPADAPAPMSSSGPSQTR